MDVWIVSREGEYHCHRRRSGGAKTSLMLRVHTSLYLAHTRPSIAFRPYGRMWCGCDDWTFGRLQEGFGWTEGA